MFFRQVLLNPTPDNNKYSALFIIWTQCLFNTGQTKIGGSWTYSNNREKSEFKLEIIL